MKRQISSRRLLLVVALCVVLALSFALLVACQDKTSATITLNYNYEGASNATIQVNADGTFNLGADPERTGYVFDGWFTDSACEKAFTDSKVSANVTLYAKWTPAATTYTVTYDYNFDNLTNVVEAQENLTHIVEEAVKRVGYRCDGYVDNNGASYNVGDTVNVTGNITLTAKWTRVYTVTFDLNGGSASYDTVIYVGRNETITLPAAPTHSTKEFDYWEDNHGSQYVAGQSVRILEDNTVFTARWKGTYTLTFDANGGQFDSDPSGEQYASGANVTITSEIPTREGYIFKGWSDGLYTYQSGDTYTMSARDTILRATWVQATRVTFNYNSLDDPQDNVVQYIEKGSRISAIEPVARANHRFGGWFLDAECTRQFMFELSDINEDTEVFAKWTHVFLRFQAYEDGWTVSGPTLNEIRAGGFGMEDLLTVPSTLRLPDSYEGKTVYGLTSGTGVDGLRYLACDESVLILGGIRSPLRKVVIPASWTEVNNRAFYCCYGIEEYVFEGNNVARIGDEAFYSNRSLRHINIPSSVTEIGKRAFEFCSQLQELDLSANHMTDIPELMAGYCYELSSIQFPQGLQVIHAKAFHQVAGITTLTLPSTLTRIEAGAFGNYSGNEETSMTGELWESYESLKNDNGVAYEDFTRTRSKLLAISIPASVTFIGDFAFAWHRNAATLTFEGGGANLQHIGAYAFAYCKSISSVELPANLAYLGYEVTYNSNGEVNGFVSNPGDYYNYDQMQLYGGVFEGCESLVNVTLPKCLQYLPPRMFRNCSALQSVTFTNDDVQFNGSWQAFANCTSIETFTIPKSVVLINDETFSGCTKLHTVIFEEGSACETIYTGVFKNCSSLKTINLPNTLQNIGGEAFKGCTSLTSITLPESIRNLGTMNSYSSYIGEVFADTGITKLELGKNVTTLKPYVFANMHLLEEVVIHKDNGMVYFTTFSVGGISYSYTFLNCENLTTLTLNDKFGGFTLEAGIGSLFGLYAFEGCTSFKEFITTDSSQYLTAIDGVLYSGGTVFQGLARSLMMYPIGKADETYTVLSEIGDDTVSEIYYRAFLGNYYLKKIIIPESVTRVHDSAFQFAQNLEEIVFEDASQLIRIGAMSFAGITTYPKDVTGAYDYEVQPIKTPLKSVTINCTAVPPMMLTTSGNTSYHAFLYSTENPQFAIYVPDELVDEFKTADGWSLLSEFIKPMSEKA